MNSSPDGSESRPDRRTVLRGFAGAATAAATGLAAYRAAAEDQPLDALIGDTDSGQFGQDFDQASRTIHMPKPTAPTLSPATAQITEHAMGAYDKIVAQGGWPEVPKVEVLKLGMRNPSVAQLRTRLSVSGDLDPNATGNDIYDSYVEEAVRRFQARHGLTIDGIVREPTLVAMNVPAATRRDQLKVNIERLKTLSTNLGPRYVVANIPAARIEAIENDVAVSRHAAVAGKPDRASPDINSKIVQINFNPYWTVPASIVRKDLIPKMQDQPEYLTDNHIRIFDARHNELQPSQINWYSNDATSYTFKQDPGDFNSLGHDPHQFPERIRRLYARHAAEEFVRRRFPFPFVRLHAGAECASAGGLAARRDQRLVARRHRSRHQIRRTQRRATDEAGAAALGLRHRLVGLRRRRAIPRGHL